MSLAHNFEQAVDKVGTLFILALGLLAAGATALAAF
jgi:hypothetical protein